MAKIDKNNLEKLLNFIDHIIDQEEDGWFRNELRKKIADKNPIGTSNEEELKTIRSILQIRGKQSVNYDFIKHSLLKEQLIIDNIRMENAALNLDELDEVERFYNFCVNVFYQIENLINFYYYKRFPKIEELLKHFENTIVQENYSFRRSGREKNVGDISMFNKLFAFGRDFFSAEGDFTNYNLENLRKVRNEGLHRCMVIRNNEDINPQLFKFLRYQNFSTIRSLLIKVVDVVREEFKEKTIVLFGEVVNVLPSVVFLKFENGETLQLQNDKYLKRNEVESSNKIKAIYKSKYSQKELVSIDLV